MTWRGDKAAGVAELNALIGSGGEPVGLIRVEQAAGVLTFKARPLEEYSAEAWVAGYLSALAKNTIAELKAQRTH